MATVMTDEKLIAKTQQRASSTAQSIVKRHMNMLKKAQPKGEPIELDSEAFRKDIGVRHHPGDPERCWVPLPGEGQVRVSGALDDDRRSSSLMW